MAEPLTSKPLWVAERRDGAGRVEIHPHPDGWELRVYLGSQLEAAGTYADVREAHDRASDALRFGPSATEV